MTRIGWLRLPLTLTYVFLYVPVVVLVIMSFTEVEESAASTWKPRTATLAEGNRRIVRLENPEVPTSLLTTFQR